MTGEGSAEERGRMIGERVAKIAGWVRHALGHEAEHHAQDDHAHPRHGHDHHKHSH